MIYIIKGKPYVKVANYYKEISIEKKENEYIAKPIGGKETRITNVNPKEVYGTTIAEYYSNKNKITSDKNINKDINVSINDSKID